MIKLTFLIRAIKPGFIHSHTLLSNLLVAFVGSIFSIPTVLSFPGLGKLKSQKGINNWILIIAIFWAIRAFENKVIRKKIYVFINFNLCFL